MTTSDIEFNKICRPLFSIVSMNQLVWYADKIEKYIDEGLKLDLYCKLIKKEPIATMIVLN